VLERVRWLLLTHPGRVVLATVYIVAAVISIVVYTVTHGPLYGLGQLVLCSFGLLWIRWCIRRWPDTSTT
jgi:hypothetical protein